MIIYSKDFTSAARCCYYYYYYCPFLNVSITGVILVFPCYPFVGTMEAIVERIVFVLA
uniref:Bm7190 n=1 Tax=Brugia malayi TaxID=6279 RepID=A0A1I9GD38_BRUMA|nr:Bm7190 [Brugia malayi]